MSKSIKLKNNNYWDSSSIVHDKQKLNDILNMTDTLYCRHKSTGNGYYADFDIEYTGSQYDRRAYFYIAVGNGAMLYAGVFSYNAGVITQHKPLTNNQATISVNDDHTIRIKLGYNWGDITLLGTSKIK